LAALLTVTYIRIPFAHSECHDRCEDGGVRARCHPESRENVGLGASTGRRGCGRVFNCVHRRGGSYTARFAVVFSPGHHIGKHDGRSRFHGAAPQRQDDSHGWSPTLRLKNKQEKAGKLKI